MTHKKIAIIAIAVLVVGLIFANQRSTQRSSSLNYDEGFGLRVASEPASMKRMAVDADYAMEESAMMIAPEPPAIGGGVAADIVEEDRLIVKNGSLSLVVDDVAAAITSVRAFATDNGGFVVSSNVNNSGIVPAGTVSVRIPSAVFDNSLDTVRRLGEVENETVSGRDVTEEYVDLEAQLGNLKATEQQFLTIMTRAQEITDILAVQRELTNVRSRIESLEGRMQYLEESAAFSSLVVYLSTDRENLPIIDETDAWKPLAVAKDALRDLRALGIDIMNALIWLAVYLPVWIALLIVYFVVRRAHRRRKNHGEVV